MKAWEYAYKHDCYVVATMGRFYAMKTLRQHGDGEFDLTGCEEIQLDQDVPNYVFIWYPFKYRFGDKVWFWTIANTNRPEEGVFYCSEDLMYVVTKGDQQVLCRFLMSPAGEKQELAYYLQDRDKYRMVGC